MASNAAAAALLVLSAAPATASPANADLTALYDSVCDARQEPGSGFRPVTTGEIPDTMQDLYIGPHEGRYWRREGEHPALVVLMRGPGHWGGVEEYCVVAVQGASLHSAAATFARRWHDRSAFQRDGNLRTWQRWGTTAVTLSGNHHRSVVVMQHPGDWLSLLTGGGIDPASSRLGAEEGN